MTKEFRQIEDYHYAINKEGIVINTDTKRILKYDTGSEYSRVTLLKNGKPNKFSLHRLLAISFIENPNNFKIVDHIDKNKSNNSISNLRWCDHSVNNYNKSKCKTASSQYYGVGFRPTRNKYECRITINKKLIYLGSFDDEVDAAKCYNDYILQNKLEELISLNIIL